MEVLVCVRTNVLVAVGADAAAGGGGVGVAAAAAAGAALVLVRCGGAPVCCTASASAAGASAASRSAAGLGTAGLTAAGARAAGRVAARLVTASGSSGSLCAAGACAAAVMLAGGRLYATGACAATVVLAGGRFGELFDRPAPLEQPAGWACAVGGWGDGASEASGDGVEALGKLLPCLHPGRHPWGPCSIPAAVTRQQARTPGRCPRHAHTSVRWPPPSGGRTQRPRLPRPTPSHRSALLYSARALAPPPPPGTHLRALATTSREEPTSTATAPQSVKWPISAGTSTATCSTAQVMEGRGLPKTARGPRNTRAATAAQSPANPINHKQSRSTTNNPSTVTAA